MTRSAFGRLEPYDAKVSSTVLRGERERKLPDLPGFAINRPKRKTEESPLRKEAKKNAKIKNPTEQAAKSIFLYIRTC